MINISFLEKKNTSIGIKEIEKKKFQIKKPKSFSEFKNFLLTEFKINDPKFIRVYSIDWQGEASEINNDNDFEEEDSIGFKCIYDKDNPIIENEIKEDNENEIEKDENEENESVDSINDDELKLILDKELEDDKKEVNNKFNSKNFCENLLSNFKNSQIDMINNTKSKIDKEIEEIMTEQSEIFSDIKNIPKIQESILKTTKKIVESEEIKKSKINKNFNNIHNNNNHNNFIKFESKDEEENEEYDFKFLNKQIILEKSIKEAKWIQINDIEFQNIGKTTFSGGDLYFFKGEDSSEGFDFPGNTKNDKNYICLEEDLNPTEISKKINLNIMSKNSLMIGQNYNFNLFLKSDKKEIKMEKPLSIIIKIIKDNDLDIQQEEEEEKEKEKLIKEKLEREEKERKEREEKERLEREAKEKEAKEREEKERLEREARERKEKEEKERIEKEAREKKEREEKERLEREAKERKEREEKERLEREAKEKEAKEKEEKERLEREAKEREEKERKEKEDKEKNDEKRVQDIFNRLEDEFYISSFKSEDEIKEKIREFNYDDEKINSWIESIM